mgnify:CR=1 FL=1
MVVLVGDLSVRLEGQRIFVSLKLLVHLTPQVQDQGLDLATTFEYGLYPFVPGDLLKLYLAGALLPGAWRLVRRFRGEG